MQRPVSFGTTPTFGQIAPGFPVAYFDFHDDFHVGSNPSEVIDRSDVWFKNNAGSSEVSRVAIPFVGTIGTAWDDSIAEVSEEGQIHLDGSTMYFSEALDTVEAGYRPVFDPNNAAVLLWARIRHDTILGTDAILTCGARNTSSAGYQWRLNGASNRTQIVTFSGGGASSQTINSDVSGIAASATWYNVAIYIDNRDSVQTVTFYEAGVASTAEAITTRPDWDGQGLSGNNLCIGIQFNTTTAANHFDGHIKRLGAINFGTSPPSGISTIVAALDANNSEPGWFLHELA